MTIVAHFLTLVTLLTPPHPPPNQQSLSTTNSREPAPLLHRSLLPTSSHLVYRLEEFTFALFVHLLYFLIVQ